MFNKAIFKQTVKANRVLWLIVTLVLTLILSLIIFQFDPSAMQQLMNTLQSAGVGADIAGDSLLSNSITILGILSQSFYTMIAIIIILVYIIITANNLIAGEVDRGSMAYTLSTPIKRTSVIFTKAMFLISSLLLMISIFTVVGIFSVQIKYQLIWGESYTNDIKEIAKQSDYDRFELEEDFNIIISNEKYVTIGSDKRAVSNETYVMYLQIKAFNKGVEASTNILESPSDDKSELYGQILASPEAVDAGVEKSKLTKMGYITYLTMMQAQEGNESGNEANDKFMENFELVYTSMGMSSIGEAIANLEKILANDTAINNAIPDPIEAANFKLVLRLMSANQLVSADNSVTFNTWSFIKINIGLFLLMFAISSISFIASSIFNLSKNSFALGAGLPLAFWVLEIVSKIDESLESVKYLSLNTLYNPSNLMTSSNNFIWNFLALLVIGIVLYILSIIIFKKKDLPL